jgi:hypothetical protein
MMAHGDTMVTMEIFFAALEVVNRMDQYLKPVISLDAI